MPILTKEGFKIFNLFKSPEEPEEVISQIDLSESPAIWVGMFKRLITNYETFAKQLIKFLGDTNPNLDIAEVERASNYMVYDKAYNNLASKDIYKTFDYAEFLKNNEKYSGIGSID